MSQLTKCNFFDTLVTKYCKKEAEFPYPVSTYRFSMFSVPGDYFGAEIKDLKSETNQPVFAKNEEDGTLRIAVFKERPKYNFNGHPIDTFFEIIQKGSETRYSVAGMDHMRPLNKDSKIDTGYEALNTLFCEVRDNVLGE